MTVDNLREHFLLAGEAIPAAETMRRIPPVHGLYSIHIGEAEVLPRVFADYMTRHGHDMIYFGKAENQFLSERLVHQDLRHEGAGSFFRSLGAVLGYTPEPNSLSGKANRNNYRFEGEYKRAIISWIDEHLSVRYVELGPIEIAYEPQLIRALRPVLNITHNPDALQELKDLRARCRSIACVSE